MNKATELAETNYINRLNASPTPSKRKQRSIDESLNNGECSYHSSNTLTLTKEKRQRSMLDYLDRSYAGKTLRQSEDIFDETESEEVNNAESTIESSGMMDCTVVAKDVVIEIPNDEHVKRCRQHPSENENENEKGNDMSIEEIEQACLTNETNKFEMLQVSSDGSNDAGDFVPGTPQSPKSEFQFKKLEKK